MGDETKIDNLEQAIKMLNGLMQSIGNSITENRDLSNFRDSLEVMSRIISQKVKKTTEYGKGGGVDTENLSRAISSVESIIEAVHEGFPAKKQLNSILGSLETLFSKYNDGTVLDELKYRKVKDYLQGAKVKKSGGVYRIEFYTDNDVSNAFEFLSNESPSAISRAGNIIKLKVKSHSQLESILKECIDIGPQFIGHS